MLGPPLPRKTSEQVPKFQVGPELPGKSPSATRQDANSEDSSFVFGKFSFFLFFLS